MEYYGGFDGVMREKGLELVGAAGVCRDWANGMLGVKHGR